MLPFAIFAAAAVTNLHMVTAYALDWNVDVRRVLLYGPVLLLIFFAPLLGFTSRKFSAHGKIYSIALAIYFFQATLMAFVWQELGSFSAFAKDIYLTIGEATLFLLFFMMLSYRQINLFANILTVLLVIATLCNLLFLLIGFEFYGEINTMTETYIGRPSGVSGNANDAGAIGCIALAFVSFQLLRSKSPLIWWILILLLIPCIFVTFSNTAQLISILILSILVFYQKRPIRTLISLSLFVLLSFYLSATYIPGIGQFLVEGQVEKLENLASLLTLNFDAIDFSNRNSLAAAGWNQVLQHPLFGNGLGVMANKMSVHNTYLQIWGDAGFFALVAYVALLVLFAVKALLAYQHDKPLSFLLLAVFTMIFLYGFTTHNILDRPKYWIVLALLLVWSDLRIKNVVLKLGGFTKLKM